MRLILILLAVCLCSCAKKPAQVLSDDWVTLSLHDKTSWMAVREIQFKDSDGNIVKPIVAYATGVYVDMREVSAWGGIEAALDGNLNTAWSSGAYKVELAFQFSGRRPAVADISMFPKNLESTRIESAGFDTDGSGVRFLVSSAAVSEAVADAARLASRQVRP